MASSQRREEKQEEPSQASSRPEQPAFIYTKDLGICLGKVTEGVHAKDDKSGIAGKYDNPALGDIYVKQDKNLAKNLVEWAFYRCASSLFSRIPGLEDIVARMSPIVLVVPEKNENAAKDIYVASVAHQNMHLAWEDAYRYICKRLEDSGQDLPKNLLPAKGKDLPARRPGGFEHIYRQYMQDFVSQFSRGDEGFSMLPLFSVLGHHGVHLGNLGVRHRELLFFDFGAAAWYDLANRQFDRPNIAGTTGDSFAKLAGYSKNYIKYYQERDSSDQYVLDPEAASRIKLLYEGFKTPAVQQGVLADLKKAFQELSQIIDYKALSSFADYLKIKGTKGLSAEDLADKIAVHLFDSLKARINYIPESRYANYESYLKTPEKHVTSVATLESERSDSLEAGDLSIATTDPPSSSKSQVSVSSRSDELDEEPSSVQVHISKR